ncbi:class I adenylate-forming enzyme family protein [Bacillus sp. JJ1566]
MKDSTFLSVYSLLEQTANKFIDEEAIFDTNKRITYGEIKQDADRLAATLSRLGISKGERLAIALPNWYETIVIYFAAAKIGAIIVPFNPKYKAYEIQHILMNSKPKMAFVTDEFDKNFGIKDALFIVPDIITVRFDRDGLTSYQELITDEEYKIEETRIDVDNDIFCILYTSGTTGVPKGVMITHRGVVQSAVTIASELHCSEQDVLILPAPLFHIFGMAVNLFCAVFVGARIILLERFLPNEVLTLIEKENVTILHGVPAMFIKLLEKENLNRFNLSSLRTGIVGASPIPPLKVKEIRDRLGMNLCQSFGITETATVTLTAYHDEERNILETLGKSIPGVELRIVNDDRSEVSVGEIGEIAIKSFGLMKGYYGMPEETSAVIDEDGWYYTGDLGVLTDHGYLKFVGRKKEMIIRGGFNIYPQEIEAVLAKNPKVIESAVVGIPDSTMGEIVCAVVKLKNGIESSEEEIKKYLMENIAKYKVPEKIVFTTNFPVTASGKIQKLKLRDIINAQENEPIINTER